jgi:hypothetical protein
MFGRSSIGFKFMINNATGSVRSKSTVPIILLEDIAGRGLKGDIISVKRGFARNYLVPRKQAGIQTHAFISSILSFCVVYASVDNKKEFAIYPAPSSVIDHAKAATL